ncbi:MAG: mandelate racemase/muconate lactonizing enzyme family protein [Chloroflexi bacterium]|nr:mandelate racemase/muconate lactonizing enzyme family protein [Chloroflexota bacterium]
MTIERITTGYYRLPLEPMGDAGHGRIDTEELITVELAADGLVGHGYAYTIGRGGRAIRSLIDHDLRPLLIGQSAHDVAALWDRMWRGLLYGGRGGLVAFAIAAVDIALWDLRGLRENRPLWALAGGTARPIPAYGSGVDLPKPLDGLLRQVEGFIQRGYSGVKVKIGKPDAAEDLARVAAVRRLVGDKIDLMIDVNMAWSIDQALDRGRRLAEYNPFWLEEPSAPEDVEGHARLVRELPMPIAVGESLYSAWEFERYIAARAAGVVQIDPVTNGGITPVLRVLRLADEAGLPTSSHYTDELSAHLLCASKNPIYLEKHAFALDPYLEQPQVVTNGTVRPTDGPGHGLRFNPEALRPYAAD